MNSSRTRSMSTTGEGLYRVMGIEKTSTPEEVKRAYRKLALKYHPDKNPNNPEATEKFQEVNHANSILSNSTKRAIYDQYGSVGLYVAEQFGEENISTYFLLNSRLCKGLFICCAIITGCYCCCCCCCCCNFCCGRYKPQVPPDEDWTDFPATEEENPEIETDSSQPIISQPGATNRSVGDDGSPVVTLQPGEATPFHSHTTKYGSEDMAS